jgi:DNA-binding transcriptional regulator YiaG
VSVYSLILDTEYLSHTADADKDAKDMQMSDTSDTRNLMASNQPMGARLKVAREKAGWSQRELAQRLGVELDSIAAWERDDREPRANRIMMRCGVLGVTLKWLLE